MDRTTTIHQNALPETVGPIFSVKRSFLIQDTIKLGILMLPKAAVPVFRPSENPNTPVAKRSVKNVSNQGFEMSYGLRQE
jgi:hypothetical protein